MRGLLLIIIYIIKVWISSKIFLKIFPGKAYQMGLNRFVLQEAISCVYYIVCDDLDRL